MEQSQLVEVEQSQLVEVEQSQLVEVEVVLVQNACGHQVVLHFLMHCLRHHPPENLTMAQVDVGALVPAPTAQGQALVVLLVVPLVSVVMVVKEVVKVHLAVVVQREVLEVLQEDQVGELGRR